MLHCIPHTEICIPHTQLVMGFLQVKRWLLHMSSRPFIKLHTSYRWMPTLPRSQCLNKAWGSPPHERIIKINQAESVLASMKLRVRCKRLHPETEISRTSGTRISCSNATAMSTSILSTSAPKPSFFSLLNHHLKLGVCTFHTVMVTECLM